MERPQRIPAWSLAALVVAGATCLASAGGADRDRLVAAMLGPTPLADDLATLSDRIGGRATGSEANRRAVAWAGSRLKDAGVDVRLERFAVSGPWLERSAKAVIAGDGISFSPRIAAMPYSVGTGPGGFSAPIRSVGRGAEADFAAIGASARGAVLLVTQDELQDVDGLFREYNETAAVEQRARAAGVAGVAYMGSRASGLLYRHNVAIGPKNTLPMVVIERDAARRAERLLHAGVALTITLDIGVDTTPAEAENVIAEIKGSTHPEEIVLMGSHLDSWDLGAGTLDNGANSVLMVDIARQIVRLGLKPSRTIRLVLWNGEELGMQGSFAYVRAHQAELDRHVVAGALDVGCGRINGFFTNGRPELVAAVGRVLEPLAGLGPFTQVDAPLVGTDNFDFMLEGVPNLVANQEPARYGPSYHAANDQLSQCDVNTLRTNGAVIAGVIWGFADDGTARLPRQTRADVEALMAHTDLAEQMKTFNLWDEWAGGTRGRH